jgi:VanZ family protein
MIRLVGWIYNQSFWLGPAWIISILYLSVSPLKQAPQIEIPGIDKLVHVGMYLWLTIFLYSLLQKQGVWSFGKKRSWLLAIVFSIAYGGMLEVVQEVFTQFRSGDWLDFLSNSLGALMAWGIYVVILKPVKLKKETPAP